MATKKFSEFVDQPTFLIDDILVGLRGLVNSQFHLSNLYTTATTLYVSGSANPGGNGTVLFPYQTIMEAQNIFSGQTPTVPLTIKVLDILTEANVVLKKNTYISGDGIANTIINITNLTLDPEWEGETDGSSSGFVNCKPIISNCDLSLTTQPTSNCQILFAMCSPEGNLTAVTGPTIAFGYCPINCATTVTNTNFFRINSPAFNSSDWTNDGTGEDEYLNIAIDSPSLGNRTITTDNSAVIGSTIILEGSPVFLASNTLDGTKNTVIFDGISWSTPTIVGSPTLISQAIPSVSGGTGTSDTPTVGALLLGNGAEYSRVDVTAVPNGYTLIRDNAQTEGWTFGPNVSQIPWNLITSSPYQLNANTGYLNTIASPAPTLNLPLKASTSEGDFFEVRGFGGSGFIIAKGAEATQVFLNGYEFTTSATVTLPYATTSVFARCARKTAGLYIWYIDILNGEFSLDSTESVTGEALSGTTYITGTSGTIRMGFKHVCTNAALTTLTLPPGTNSSVGQEFEVMGETGSGGYLIMNQPVGSQVQRYQNQISTVGVGGYSQTGLTPSDAPWTYTRWVCEIADTAFRCVNLDGQLVFG